jgi:hypothetical protein
MLAASAGWRGRVLSIWGERRPRPKEELTAGVKLSKMTYMVRFLLRQGRV